MVGKVERVRSKRSRSPSVDEEPDRRLSITARLQQHAGYQAIKQSSDM